MLTACERDSHSGLVSVAWEQVEEGSPWNGSHILYRACGSQGRWIKEADRKWRGGGGCKSGGSEKLGCLFVLKKEEKKHN